MGPNMPERNGARESLENQFAAAANTLYESLLDLNVSRQQLTLRWNGLLVMRAKILSMYGVQDEVPTEVKASTGGVSTAAAAPAGLSAVDPAVDWKSKLNEAVVKRAKRSLVKNELAYTVQEDGSGRYTAELTSALLLTPYKSRAPAASKRAAEHAAAREALMAEFPEVVQLRTSTPPAPGVSGVGQAPGGKKRKASGELDAEDAKSRLAHAVQLLLRRPVAKDDVVYETVPIEGDGATNTSYFMSTVAVPEYDPDVQWESQPCQSKKQAEMGAAEAALASLAGLIAPLEEERKARKAKLNKEKLAQLKQSVRDRVEAKRVAAGVEATTPGCEDIGLAPLDDIDWG